jgi:hypothetical protein
MKDGRRRRNRQKISVHGIDLDQASVVKARPFHAGESPREGPWERFPGRLGSAPTTAVYSTRVFRSCLHGWATPVKGRLRPAPTTLRQSSTDSTRFLDDEDSIDGWLFGTTKVELNEERHGWNDNINPFRTAELPERPPYQASSGRRVSGILVRAGKAPTLPFPSVRPTALNQAARREKTPCV